MVSVSPRNEQTLPAYNSSPKQSVSRHVRNRNPPNRYRSEDVSQMFQIKQTHALEMYPRLITVSSEILCCCLFRRLGLEVFCSRNNATAAAAYLLLVSKNHNKHFFTTRKRFSFPPTALLWVTSTKHVSCAEEENSNRRTKSNATFIVSEAACGSTPGVILNYGACFATNHLPLTVGANPGQVIRCPRCQLVSYL